MNKAQIIIENIHTRRTIKPEQCIPGEITESDVWKILECANWAPTHGYTEPWRFVVFSGNAKHQFAFDHAEMYKAESGAENFKQIKYDKLIHRAKTTSHILAIVNKRGSNPRIPEIEELQATAMAVQNMQLAASAMGFAAYIHSGGMTSKLVMKEYLGFEKEDQVLGFLYLGIPNGDEKAPGRRISTIQNKVEWKE